MRRITSPGSTLCTLCGTGLEPVAVQQCQEQLEVLLLAGVRVAVMRSR